MLLRGPLFDEGDPLQDGPEHDPQGEDVCLGCVAQARPNLRCHVEVGAAGGGEVLPGQVAVHHAFAHLAQTKVCYLQDGQKVAITKVDKPQISF